MPILELTHPVSDFQIQKISEVLSSEGVVIYPTETIYGIGCLATSESAKKRIYKIKLRDASKPVIFLVKDWRMVKDQLKIAGNESVIRLVNTFWPGPLTLIVHVDADVQKRFHLPTPTVAVRQSNHPLIERLWERVLVPIVSTSANISGKPTEPTFEGVIAAIGRNVDLAVKDSTENAARAPSTILNVSKTPFHLIREGSISKQQIESVIDEEIN